MAPLCSNSKKWAFGSRTRSKYRLQLIFTPLPLFPFLSFFISHLRPIKIAPLFIFASKILLTAPLPSLLSPSYHRGLKLLNSQHHKVNIPQYPHQKTWENCWIRKRLLGITHQHQLMIFPVICQHLRGYPLHRYPGYQNDAIPASQLYSPMKNTWKQQLTLCDMAEFKEYINPP